MLITLLNCAYTLCVTCFAFPTFLQSKGKMCFIRDICLFEFVQKVLSCQKKLKCMSYSSGLFIKFPTTAYISTRFIDPERTLCKPQPQNTILDSTMIHDDKFRAVHGIYFLCIILRIISFGLPLC